jgi:hypothetical protein
MALVLCEANQFELLTAPVIAAPMADAFPIAGPFTHEHADALAARINHVSSTLPK